MDRATIEFNFTRAKQQAAELDSAAGNVRTMANSNIQNCIQGTANAWKGENSIKFIAKGDTIKSKFVSVASGINSVASTVRAIAQNIYNAEMEALRIEEERAYQARLAAEAAQRAREEAEKAAAAKGRRPTYSGGGGRF